MNVESQAPLTSRLRRAVIVVAALNFAYGVIEFGIALAAGSVSLFADSVDFFEDTSVNLLIFFALAWRPRLRARIGMLLAAILLVPALATLWMALVKIESPFAPAHVPLGLAAFGALAVNVVCAFVLARHRAHHGSVARAAWLSARNDAVANLGMILAAFVTGTVWRSAWPDLVVGLAIFALNLDAARSVWRAAHREYRDARARP